MTKQFYKDSFGWGFVLWLVGYILGILLFPIAPPSLLGWLIMPIGVFVTMYVLLKKIKSDSFKHFVLLSFIWVLMAIVLDYFFNVKMFKIVDYYKLDIYVYYFLTLAMPLAVGFKKSKF